MDDFIELYSNYYEIMAKECQHESDGVFWIETQMSYAPFTSFEGACKSGAPVFNKCQKCGEFYR